MPTTSASSVILALGTATIAAAQSPTWRADLVGSPPATWTSATAAVAVNDAGLVLGFTTVASVRRPWVGSPTTGLQLLPLPANTTYADALAVNEAGVVAGQVLVSGSVSRGVIWQPTANGYQLFMLPSGSNGQFPFDARGINDRGDVVGKYGPLAASYVWNATSGVTQIAGFPDIPDAVNNQRQILGGTLRMDLDTSVLEDLGNPTGTGFNYLFTELWKINDAGECGGYGNVATGQTRNKQAVRFTDGPTWIAFNAQPATSANVTGLAATGDTAYQVALLGMFVYVDGHGSLTLQSMLAPAYAHWNLSGSFAPVISRGGRVACNGVDSRSGQAGIVLLTPLPFVDLGGGTLGALGRPVLNGYGRLRGGEQVRLRLASAALASPAFLALSTRANPLPIFGGTFHPDAASAVVVPLPTDRLGRVDLTLSWPSAPSGTTVFVQAGALDAAANQGVCLSNAIVGAAE
ncbi:MAG: hypothetical protein R3F56_20005 [Planctomycetota bacterium]